MKPRPERYRSRNSIVAASLAPGWSSVGMIRAIAASTVARWWASKNRPLMVAPRSLLARLADRDRDDDDGAAGDELLAELEPHQDEAVVDQADHQRADDRSHDGAHPAEQA